jgi:hypothetical protein
LVILADDCGDLAGDHTRRSPSCRYDPHTVVELDVPTLLVRDLIDCFSDGGMRVIFVVES